MSDRLCVVLLVVLIAIVAVAAYLQVQANTRIEGRLNNIERQLVLWNSPLPPQPAPDDGVPAPSAPPATPEPATPPASAPDQPEPDGQTVPPKSTEPPAPLPVDPKEIEPPVQPEPKETQQSDQAESSDTPEPPVETQPEPPKNPEPPAVEEDKDWMDYREAIAKVIDDLLAGREQAVYEQFNNNLTSVLPLEMLQKVMEPIRIEHGRAMRITQHQRLRIGVRPEMHAYQVMVETEKGKPLLFTITIDEQDKIAGLYVK